MLPSWAQSFLEVMRKIELGKMKRQTQGKPNRPQECYVNNALGIKSGCCK